MLNNFIYAQTKDLFLEALGAGNILDEAIVFIEDTKEIWNHGHYFGGEGVDPAAFANLQTQVNEINSKYVKIEDLPENTDHFPTPIYDSGLQISEGLSGLDGDLFIPYADDTTPGLISTDSQLISGLKVFVDGVEITADNGYASLDVTGTKITTMGRYSGGKVNMGSVCVSGINGIAEYSANEHLFNCNDTSLCTINDSGVVSTVGFYDTSDERLKNFGPDITVDFEKLRSIPKKYFTWKDGGKDLQIGTSAQEVQKIYPELVSENEKGELSVSYNKLSIVALSAVDQLYDKTKELETRIANLEKLLEANGIWK
jgi:hypothetical protein